MFPFPILILSLIFILNEQWDAAKSPQKDGTTSDNVRHIACLFFIIEVCRSHRFRISDTSLTMDFRFWSLEQRLFWVY